MSESETGVGAQQRSVSAAAGVVFSLQALVGFTIGGLLAIVVTLTFGLYAEGWVAAAGRVLGFAACGALGGAALGVGLRPEAWKSGALGFGLGFVLPALLAGPVLTDLMSLQLHDYGANTFAFTFLAFACSFGAAGALGASFLEGRLWLPVGTRFFVAAGAGGLVAAFGPGIAGEPSDFSLGSVIGALGTILAGHMFACGLGGWLAGLAVENDVKAQARPQARPRRTAKRARSGAGIRDQGRALTG